MSGTEVIRQARRLAPKMPIVMMTAEPEHLVPERSGIDMYLHKPFRNLEAVETAVESAIRLSVDRADKPS
jgi:CheY-like chemotaxis protein